MSDAGSLPSVIQDEWVAIAERTRIELQKRMAEMPAMTPGELESFVGALGKAEQFELRSHAWDERIRDWLDSLARGFD